MVDLTLTHRTRYRYRREVSLDPHRLMLRPRDGRLLQVTAFDLAVSPRATIDWTQDAFGNAVAIAAFETSATELVIESRVALRLAEPVWPVFPIDVSAIGFPFDYKDDERADLGALRTPQFPDQEGRLAAWARRFVVADAAETLALLRDLNDGVRSAIAYEAREDDGTQAPLASLARSRGSCRDLATLLAEALRHLGFGARLVSGYLWDPSAALVGSAGGGSTHAWVETYVPGAGWVALDPTNGAVGAGHLVPVAAARRIEQIAPVAGGFVGRAEDFLDMDVAVRVAAG